MKKPVNNPTQGLLSPDAALVKSQDDAELIEDADDYAEHLFSLELLRCSLDEIRVNAPDPYSDDQLVAHYRAHELAEDVVHFLIHEASKWGVGEEHLRPCVHGLWKDYIDKMGEDGSGEVESHKHVVERWLPESIGHFQGNETLH